MQHPFVLLVESLIANLGTCREIYSPSGRETQCQMGTPPYSDKGLWPEDQISVEVLLKVYWLLPHPQCNEIEKIISGCCWQGDPAKERSIGDQQIQKVASFQLLLWLCIYRKRYK
ncbi:hypothetical protein CEXT_509581 [Caerostris extrusa]|uniref:Uncharacterized protein n=1 Tax=Caerostris extrusa TaxID=172846 RepID=A0AAV4PW26_CAEEX|nr:hypothetical protein CEXT_509581 [Caerostris extrusa]